MATQPSSAITKEDVSEIKVDVLQAPEPGNLVIGVKAYTLKDVPGLCVARTLEKKTGSWSVVHIESGRKLLAPWKTAMQALIVTRAIRDLADWTKTGPELARQPGLKASTAQVWATFGKANVT